MSRVSCENLYQSSRLFRLNMNIYMLKYIGYIYYSRIFFFSRALKSDLYPAKKA